MKRAYGILLLLTISAIFLTQCQNTITNPDPSVKTLRPLTHTEQMLANSSQSFGVDVFRNLAENTAGKNVFISPLSLSMALGMTVNGAADSTRTAMMNALEVSETDVPGLDASYQSLIKLLTNADPQVKMQLANSIWYRNTFQVQQNFIDTCKNFFGAQVQGLDFGSGNAANVINNWVSDKTNGLITKMVQPPISDTIVMYLINAIYFKGSWRYQFDKSKTEPGDFTLSNGRIVKPDMMQQTATFPTYRASDGTQMLDMAYGDSLFSMTVILPPSGTNIDTFISGLTRAKLDNWISQLYRTKIQVIIPKFKIAYDTTFNKVLADMGMGVAFSPKYANFTNINPDKSLHLHISQVKQKSYVKVDEEGTEAAAVTAVSMGVTAVGPTEPPVFRADRPFVYLIRERTSGTILFIGKMENPTE